ncbi:hypothetical protein [Brevibacillus choshinensis]|uniref:hypothetical protein n=1 Tax=Brevibacillus choshinensis TaxID=54911 RepID=UPI0006EBE314|nr:hypothetical protein [Brevibacillus choshinensis]
MNFNSREAVEVLERTPQTVEYFLSGLSDGWLQCNEGEVNYFPHFDLFSHLNERSVRTMELTLLEFKEFRKRNITKLKDLIVPDLHLELMGSHCIRCSEGKGIEIFRYIKKELMEWRFIMKM